MTSEMTPEEFLGSLTGFDDIGIEKAFGDDITGLQEKRKGFALGRAMVFVDFKRKGQKHDEAYQSAMSLSINDLDSYFAGEELELDPSDPETDQGKDDSPSA